MVPGKTGELFGSFIGIFTGMDFQQGIPFLLIATVASLFCCFEGFRIYKAVLALAGFYYGYQNAEYIMEHFLSSFLSGMHLTGEAQFMAKAVIGLIVAALAYRIVLFGIFILAYRFGLQNLPSILDSPVTQFLQAQGWPEIVQRPVTGLVSFAAALAVGYGASKANRIVLVVLTAVVGGFSLVNFLQTMLELYDFGIVVPPPSSPVWIVAKLFISAAGVAVQGVKGPENARSALD